MRMYAVGPHRRSLSRSRRSQYPGISFKKPFTVHTVNTASVHIRLNTDAALTLHDLTAGGGRQRVEADSGWRQTAGGGRQRVEADSGWRQTAGGGSCEMLH
ncbi:unnamed protein product [Leuciscus chuanchicus]